MMRARLLAWQLTFTNQDYLQQSKPEYLMEKLAALNSVFVKCYTASTLDPKLFSNILRLIWNALFPHLTKANAPLLIKDLVVILKKVSSEYSKNQSFRDFLKTLESDDLDVLENIFKATIDSGSDSSNHKASLQVCDWGLRIFTGMRQAGIWLRKALILNTIGKGSSLIPMKEENLEIQAYVWRFLGTSLRTVEKQNEAFQIGLKLLSSKKAVNTWYLKEYNYEYHQWAINAGLKTRREIQPMILDSIEEIMKNNNPLNYVHLGLREQLSFISHAADKHQKLEHYEKACNFVNILLQKFRDCYKPILQEAEKEEKKEKEKDDKKSKTLKGGKPDKKEPVSRAQTVDKFELPAPDQWHSFEWPLAAKAYYSMTTDSVVLSKQNLKTPLELCSLLLELAVELLHNNLAVNSFPSLALAVLISELSCSDYPELLNAIQLFYAFVLAKAGFEKRAKEKYKLTYKTPLMSRETHQLILHERPISNPRRHLVGTNQQIYLFKAELCIAFGDYAESQILLSQAISLSKIYNDHESLLCTYAFSSLLNIQSKNYKEAQYFAQLAIRADPNLQSNHSLLYIASNAISNFYLGNSGAKNEVLGLFDQFIQKRSIRSVNQKQKKIATVFKLWYLCNVTEDLDEKAISQIETAFNKAIRECKHPNMDVDLMLQTYDNYIKVLSENIENPSVRSRFTALYVSQHEFYTKLTESDIQNPIYGSILCRVADVEIRDFHTPVISPPKTIMDILDEFLAKADLEKKELKVKADITNFGVFEKLASLTSLPKTLSSYYSGMKTYMDLNTGTSVFEGELSFGFSVLDSLL